MQTPGLPASSPSSPRHNADSFFSDQPSHAAEQFGDVMNRTLHSGTGILPVRTGTQEQNAQSVSRHVADLHRDEKSVFSKIKKTASPRIRKSTNARTKASGNSHFIGMSPVHSHSRSHAE